MSVSWPTYGPVVEPFIGRLARVNAPPPRVFTVTELPLATRTDGLSLVLGSFGTDAGTSTTSSLPELEPSVSSKATPAEPAGQLTSAARVSTPVALGSSATSAAARPGSGAPQLAALPVSVLFGAI